jgi:hypothetical protein
MVDGQQEENETVVEDERDLDYFGSVTDGDEKDDKQLEKVELRSWENDEDEEACDRRGTARVFMEGMTGDEKMLSYRDQVDVVAGFVEQAIYKGCERPVALLDDRKSGDTPSMRQKDFRPRRWTLTLKELRAELSKQVTDILHFMHI